MSSDISLKFCDSNSILIINGEGIIKHLYTPFKVQCIEHIGKFTMGSFVFVQEVAPGNGNELIYLIGEGAYFHKYFRIAVYF